MICHHQTLICVETMLEDGACFSSSWDKFQESCHSVSDCESLVDMKIKSNTRSVVSSTPETRLQQRLQFFVTFCNSSTNQDIVIKVLLWPLFLLGLDKLAYQVSYARYVTRFLGLPAALDAALHNSWNATSENAFFDSIYRWLGKFLALSMVLYYPMEHAAFLLWVQPTTSGSEDITALWWMDGNTWSYISCRCWFVYVLADLTQCLLQLVELSQNKFRNKSAYLDVLDLSVLDRLHQLARNVAMLYPSMYWSMPQSTTGVHPLLSSSATVYALMWVEGLLHLHQSLLQ